MYSYNVIVNLDKSPLITKLQALYGMHVDDENGLNRSLRSIEVEMFHSQP